MELIALSMELIVISMELIAISMEPIHGRNEEIGREPCRDIAHDIG